MYAIIIHKIIYSKWLRFNSLIIKFVEFCSILMIFFIQEQTSDMSIIQH